MLEGDKEGINSLKYFYRPDERINKKVRELTPDELQKLTEYDILLKEKQLKMGYNDDYDDDYDNNCGDT